MNAIIIVFVLVTGAGAELILTVAPDIVEPGFTQSFTVNCALLDNEQTAVVSMSISRRTSANGDFHVGSAERIASLGALSPHRPSVVSGFGDITAIGQITTFESEMGSYLRLIWPAPSVDDLGLYTCEALVLGEMGQLLTLLAEARVTTADPVSDRLLVEMLAVEDQMEKFNVTLEDLQNQVDIIRAAQSKDSEVQGDETEQKEETTEGEGSVVDELALAVEGLGSRLESMSVSISSLENKILEIEKENNETREDNERGLTASDALTFPSPEPDYIYNVFFHNNSTYFLVSGNRQFSTYLAQSVCESVDLSLVKITDKEELQMISNNTISHLKDDQLMLVGGRRRPGNSDWLWHDTGEKVPFLSWMQEAPSSHRNGVCLALRREVQGQPMSVTTVECSALHHDVFFLCEDEN